MGVHRLFSGGGQRHSVWLKMPKNIPQSFKKVKKHTILAGKGGGQDPPLALPFGRPWLSENRQVCFRIA